MVFLYYYAMYKVLVLILNSVNDSNQSRRLSSFTREASRWSESYTNQKITAYV